MTHPHENDFEAPISPWTERERSSSFPESFQCSGQRLFDQVSEFYAWYMSWDITPKEHAETFELLSRIMRIAQVCRDGGLFLNEDEEQKALRSVSSLREELFDGHCRQQEIPQNLLKIIQALITNPKARLVAKTNELEYMLCIRSSPENESQALKFQQILNEILNKITPTFLDIHAHAISQGLSKIIENIHTIDDVEDAIIQATKHWM